MVGRRVEMPARVGGMGGGEIVAKLDRVGVAPMAGRQGLRDVTLDLRAGEIVGIAGVSGNGQVALAELLSGVAAAASGHLSVCGTALPASPRRWIEAGVARIPEDRHAEGAVGDLAVWENIVIEQLGNRAFVRAGVIRGAASRRFAGELARRFDVRGGGIDVPTRTLSGGNMQKLILGRAFSVRGGRAPTLVVASQPTWGLDIGAVAYVRGQLLDAAAQGAAVLLISEDLDELMALSDRIAVIHAGHLTPARATPEWTLATLGLAMAGAGADAGQTNPEVAHAA